MDTNSDSDHRLDALMQRYSGGDDAVFEELYRCMASPLRRFCLRLARDGSDADDLLQETMLRVHRARATYVAGSAASHWAFAIARSVHLDRLRYRRRRREELGSGSDAADRAEHGALATQRSPEADALARDLALVVAAELSRMSEKNRVAYVLLKVEGLSVEAAAAILGTTATTVRQRAHRAYRQLREAVASGGWREKAADSWEAVPVVG